jgi:hypothetical protein
MKISSTGFLKTLAIFKAKRVDGIYLFDSIAFIPVRQTTLCPDLFRSGKKRRRLKKGALCSSRARYLSPWKVTQ